MQQPPSKHSWPEIILLALIPLGFILAAGGGGRTMLDAFAAMGFFAVILFLAWLLQRGLRRPSPRPLTTRGRLWNAAVLLAVLTFLGLLIWWNYEPTGPPPSR
jgi:hypothetical protein